MILTTLSPAVISCAFLCLTVVVRTQSLSDIYAPEIIECPDDIRFVRIADSISNEEKNYIDQRLLKTSRSLENFLERSNIPEFCVSDFIDNMKSSVTIGIAVSGGGFRSLLTGAGIMSALDIHTPNSTSNGHLGGILQATSYFSGLSGGAWLLGSWIFNNMPAMHKLQNSNDIWNFERNIIIGDYIDTMASGTGYNFTKENLHQTLEEDQCLSENEIEMEISRIPGLHNTVDSENVQQIIGYYRLLHDEVQYKNSMGFKTSITDYWARAIYRQFLASADGNMPMTWSNIQNITSFKAHQMPFPIATAISHKPGTRITTRTSTIVEFNPFEFGSWNPTLHAFAITKYLGTHLFDGEPYLDDECIVGFDNASFVLGTSSSLFNDLIFYLTRASSGITRIILEKLKDLADFVGLGEDGKSVIQNWDHALYSPNPFYGFHKTEKNNYFTSQDTLFLGDGGEDGQNIPLEPLLRPERHVDVIFAIDATAELNGFPNASALTRAAQRYLDSDQAEDIAFPDIPDEETLLAAGVHEGPKIFGCYLEKYPNAYLFNHSDTAVLPPLIIYLANRSVSYASNTSTVQMTYSSHEKFMMIQNGYNIVTNSNSTEWTQCIGCAIINREMIRQQTEIPQFCEQCFQDYCFN